MKVQKQLQPKQKKKSHKQQQTKEKRTVHTQTKRCITKSAKVSLRDPTTYSQFKHYQINKSPIQTGKRQFSSSSSSSSPVQASEDKEQQQQINANNNPNPTKAPSTSNLNIPNIPLFDLDDFFTPTNNNNTNSKVNKIPTYTPQSINTAPHHITTNVITLITKECCTLCIPAKDSIVEAYQTNPNKFHYMEVDIEDPDNAEYRGRYKYTIPVVLINGEKFSNKGFTDADRIALFDRVKDL